MDAFSGTLASKRRRISAQVESVGGVPLPRGAGAAGALEEALALAEGASFLVARRPHVAPCAGCATFAVCADCATRGLGDWHRSGECAALANVARDDAALAGDSAPLRLLLRYAAAKRHGDWCVGAKEPLSWIGTLVAPRTRCLGDRDARSLAAASGVPLDDVHRLVGQIHSNAARISRDGRAAGCALSAHVGFATRGARRLRPTSPRASATVAARALSAGRRARAESHRSVRRSAGATSTRPSERRVPAQANHDCAPNCAARVDAAGMVALTALCDLAAGDELTISYVDERLPHAERRKILRDHYGFDCACGRCAAERKALLAKARHRAR